MRYCVYMVEKFTVLTAHLNILFHKRNQIVCVCACSVYCCFYLKANSQKGQDLRAN